MTLIRENLTTMEYGNAPESPAQVEAWLELNKSGFGHFIDGEFLLPKGAKLQDVINPATDEKIAKIAIGSDKDIDKGVKAAVKAFASWSKTSPHKRAKYLYAIARQIQKRERFLSVLETIDNGKTIRETRDIDIPLAARHFYHHAGWAQLIDREFGDYEPVGVCAQVIPWNFPLLMLAWKIAPALAAGNCVVLKPADLTPLSAIAFAQICQDVGLPKGVVNIINGDGKTGAALCAHNDVDKVAFTGSTQVGRTIRQQIAGSGKKLSLELGGKSPFIVFEDADLDGAIEGIVDAIWFNQGEVCCAGSRILIQEGIAPRFIEKMKTRLKTMRIGDPLDKTMDMGAIVSQTQLKRINSLIEKGRAEGAILWQSESQLPKKGSFCQPGFFTQSEPSSTINQDEIFGPIAVTGTFRTPSEAIALANNTRYGLAASIWSENINIALDVAAQVKAGVVWINATNLFDAGAGFGGYRESGFGREGAREGMLEYLTPKSQRQLRDVSRRDSALLTPNPDTHAIENNCNNIDSTAKLYIGGKQCRPDSGYSAHVYGIKDKEPTIIGSVGIGSRKDIRNGVEAASKASSWSSLSAHNRAQIIYYIGENLDSRRDEFVQLLMDSTGQDKKQAQSEVEASISRIFTYGAWADKFDGAVHSTKSKHVTLAMNEPWGVMGIVQDDDAPLLSLVSLLFPAIAMGNRVVSVASQAHPLIATRLYQVLETSDVPAGVINIITGNRDELAKTLAEHDGVNALWYVGSHNGCTMVENASTGNLKATWVSHGKQIDWYDRDQGEAKDWLYRATQVKNIWVPYGA